MNLVTKVLCFFFEIKLPSNIVMKHKYVERAALDSEGKTLVSFLAFTFDFYYSLNIAHIIRYHPRCSLVFFFHLRHAASLMQKEYLIFTFIPFEAPFFARIVELQCFFFR